MFSHSSQEIIILLHFWGYPLMFILMVIEGPVVTIVSAFLASIGLFNIFVVFGLSVAGDVVGDIILYSIGYFGGSRILLKAEKILKVSAEKVEKLKNKFHENSAKIIFYVKSTTGLSYITFILAGTLKMKFQSFIRSSILGGLVWSSMLVALGYFLGYAADKIDRYIKYAGFAVFSLALIAFFIIIVYKKRQAKKLLENGS